MVARQIPECEFPEGCRFKSDSLHTNFVFVLCFVFTIAVRARLLTAYDAFIESVSRKPPSYYCAAS